MKTSSKATTAYNSLVIAWRRTRQLAGQQTATTPQPQSYIDQMKVHRGYNGIDERARVQRWMIL
jgi:hypothetical protein